MFAHLSSELNTVSNNAALIGPNCDIGLKPAVSDCAIWQSMANSFRIIKIWYCLCYCRIPVFSALGSSHHHKVGNADMPYFGNGLGRPKRSHRAVRDLPYDHCGTT